MKKFLALTMTGVMLLSSNVLGATNIFYNDSLVTYTDQTPVIINDRTYVPIRDVFEKMGFQVDWEQSLKLVTISNDYYYVYIKVDTNGLWILDKAMQTTCTTLTDKVQLVNGRTMLPLRQILEAMGYSIQWDGATKSSIVVDNNNYTELDNKYNEFISTVEKLDDGYEIDNTKEIGDFTEEEYVYFAALKENITKISECLNDEGSFELTPEALAAASEIYKMSCPESLGSFGSEINQALKNCAFKLSDFSEQKKLMLGDENMSFEFGFTFAISLMYNIANEFMTPINTLNSVGQERNIPHDVILEVLSVDYTENNDISE